MTTPTPLPEEITRAMDELERAVESSVTSAMPDTSLKARAALEAAIRKWGRERYLDGLGNGYAEGSGVP